MNPKFCFLVGIMLIALFLMNPDSRLYAQQGQTQSVEIKGIVYDDAGLALTGATVKVVCGSLDKGGVTDLDGNFSIRVSSRMAGDPETYVEVSFVGFKKERQKLSPNKKKYKFVLRSSLQEIDEVVVTGFGNIDARRNTSAITSLKMDDILMPGMTTIDQALEGRVPDMIFMQNSGEVGATARMRIRGTSTLVGNREPLWVLDGIPLTDPVDVTVDQLNDPDYINYVGNAISGINPQDIDRIDVLKDAAATALYGTRAANGVIVITTKKGTIGEPVLSYSTQLKLIRRPRYTDHNINLMNSQERVAFGKELADSHYRFPENMTMVGYEGAYNSWITGQISYEEFQKQVWRNEKVNTDWFDILSREALTQTHTVSLSGGSEKNRYYASLGYTDEQGVVKTQYSKRYTASMNMTTDITNSLQVNVRLNGNVAKKNYLPSDINALSYAYNTTRALPCYNEDGSLYYYQRHAYNIGTEKPNTKFRYNILNEIQNSAQTHDSNQLIAAMDLRYRYKTILDAVATISYQRQSSTNETWYGEKTNYVAQLKNGEVDASPIPGEAGKCDLPYGGVLNTGDNVTDDFTTRLQLNYHDSFGKNKNHWISASFGYEVNTYRSHGYSDETRGYFKDRGMKYLGGMKPEEMNKFPYFAKWKAENHRYMTSGKTNKLSGYLTTSYSYGEYFTINLNGRFDASNKFGSRSNEKFLPVWSVSGMFNAKETLLKNVTMVNDLRIRLSFGKTGNMVDGQTPNVLLQMGSINPYYDEYYSKVNTFPNPNLRWEQTNQVNGGFDLSMFENRLMIGGDVYYKKTKDAFTEVSVPAVNGVRSYVMNGGDITNWGYSISLAGYPIRNKNWQWYLSTNYSYVRNKVDSDLNENYGLSDYLNGAAIVKGESVSTFYSYDFLGLNPINGMPMFEDYGDRRHLLEGKTLQDIVQMVMVNSGTRDPKFSGSLYSTLTWKQLSLATNFTYSLGNKIRKFALYTDIKNGISSESNVRKEFLDRWKAPGDEKRTVYPAIISKSSPDYNRYITHWSNTGGTTALRGYPTFATDYFSMYDMSNLRVVSGSYLRLSSLTLRYNFPSKMLVKTPISRLSVDFSTSNVFTICSKELDGQDPSQSGFSAETALSIRPSYTFGLQVSF